MAARGGGGPGGCNAASVAERDTRDIGGSGGCNVVSVAARWDTRGGGGPGGCNAAPGATEGSWSAVAQPPELAPLLVQTLLHEPLALLTGGSSPAFSRCFASLELSSSCMAAPCMARRAACLASGRNTRMKSLRCLSGRKRQAERHEKSRSRSRSTANFKVSSAGSTPGRALLASPAQARWSERVGPPWRWLHA